MMRCLRRNKVPFYYALYEESTEVLDEYGNLTGTERVSYSDPVRDKANISPARNNDTVELFGTDINYDKVIVMCPADVPIDEHSVLWVDTLPELDEEGHTETPYDYIVRKVARSLNSVSIAIAKVDVRHGT